MCSSPSCASISVPEAGRLPSGSLPAIAANAPMTSGGNPSGYVGNGALVVMPAISQCPVIVSLPFERSAKRATNAAGRSAAGTPRIAVKFPSPSRAQVVSRRPPSRSATLASVLAPGASPYVAASGRAPMPPESRTRTMHRPISASASKSRVGCLHRPFAVGLAFIVLALGAPNTGLAQANAPSLATPIPTVPSLPSPPPVPLPATPSASPVPSATASAPASGAPASAVPSGEPAPVAPTSPAWVVPSPVPERGPFTVSADRLIYYSAHDMVTGEGNARVALADGTVVTGAYFSMDLKLNRFLVAGGVELTYPGGHASGAAFARYLDFSRTD